MLAEHKRIIPKLKKAGLKSEAKEQNKELKEIKKKALKKLVGKYKGKGGLIPTPFVQASTPIDLLKKSSIPPTVQAIPKSKENSFGKS